MNTPQPLQDLFAKYLQDKCTAEEIRSLLTYFSHLQNERQLRSLIAAELVKGEDTRFENGDAAVIEKVRAALLEKIREENISGAWLKNTKEEGQQGPFLWPARIKYAAFWFLLACASALIIGHYFADIRAYLHPTKIETIATLRGQRKSITLPDGSKIWLSPSSSLKYPDQFNGNTRDVKLEGEAFFEVAKDKTHPFIISSGKLEIQVVGTRFMVQGREARPTVTVVSGIVKVSTPGKGTNGYHVTVIADQRSVFDPKTDSLIGESYPDAPGMLKRREGILSYKGTSVNEVLADFSKYYDVPVKLENGSRHCACFGEFNTNRPIAICLDQLAIAINAKVIVRNGVYVLQGGCDKR